MKLQPQWPDLSLDRKAVDMVIAQLGPDAMCTQAGRDLATQIKADLQNNLQK